MQLIRVDGSTFVGLPPLVVAPANILAPETVAASEQPKRNTLKNPPSPEPLPTLASGLDEIRDETIDPAAALDT
ncbi:hypothetical protein bcgnr5398_55550 [Bacillus cereus]